jgi:hypothetical protein
MEAYEKIGLCGTIGSGKSHVARLLGSLGYKHINSDALYKTSIATNPAYQACLDGYLRHKCPSAFMNGMLMEGNIVVKGVSPNFDGVYSVSELSRYLFGPVSESLGYEPIESLSNFNAPYILSELKRHIEPRCVVEMATLPTFEYFDALNFDIVIHIVGGSVENAIARDKHRDENITRSVHAYQTLELSNVHELPNVRTLKTTDNEGNFLSDDEILQNLKSLLSKEIYHE